MYLGAQGNLGSDTDFGVGARLLANLEATNLEFAGSYDIYFPDNDLDYWEFNANLFYHIHPSQDPSVLPYLGGGLNVGHLSNGSGNTEAGVNLGGGIRFPGRQLTPFVEARAVMGDFDQGVLTVGLLFGHAHGH